ncbi:MAG: class I SAM-dependent methyltransferase [Bacteroidota bacterium]
MVAFGQLLPPAPAMRRGIPLYYAKTEAEVKEDVYERYDELVTRQTALHLADDLHGSYPFSPLLDYLLAHLPQQEDCTFADIGCSVGRLAAEVAIRHATWDTYALDLSYQMLRQGNDFWVKGISLRPNLIRYGWGTPTLAGHTLPNVHFALAKGEQLPFSDASLDVVLNTFLIDRLPTPFSAFEEWQRVLKPGGLLITVSPLNFLRPEGWRAAFPPVKILAHLQTQGWQIEDWTDPLPLHEPMDLRGNGVNWQCLAFVVRKG